MGRLLITLLLCARGALEEPLLYLSLYFKTHRERYYDLLQRVRTEGVWEEWLEFFLEGAETTARQAADSAVQLLGMFSEDRKRIQGLGRPASSALRVHEFTQKRPVITIAAAAKALEMSVPTVTKSLCHLVNLGIMREVTGKQRGRVFIYQRYLNVASAGTEPLPSGNAPG